MNKLTLDEKLKKKSYTEIWQEYCGFLDLSLSSYINIQERLLLEQIEMYNNCNLGKKIMNGQAPSTMQEFRQMVPLTTYEDYAEILLAQKEEDLPKKPLIWIQTTWEGGKHPVKMAPYTFEMIDGHKGNFLACMILSTSKKKGHFALRSLDKFLYGMAPLPYLTGIVPHVLEGELTVEFLPAQKEADKMSFSQRNKEGFKLGLRKGIDLFFGLSSVVCRISESFLEGGGSGRGSSINVFQNSAKMNWQLLKVAYLKKIRKQKIYPKHLWNLKGLICIGTDSAGYKKKVEEYWGIKPTEIFAGTEPTLVGTETWSKNGMVFFPDTNFYEFIPYSEMEKNIDNPLYTPKSYLIDEVVEGEIYEVVITSLKGGAFARYRVGDMFKCVSLTNEKDEIMVPQFSYVDRVPTIIDIAGFTRITKTTIEDAIALSRLSIHRWIAVKEYDEEQRPYMHLYLEVKMETLAEAITSSIIKEHLSIYFKYIDNDYKDLKKMLGIEPLQVSVLPFGTMEQYEKTVGRQVRSMNPSSYDVTEITKIGGLRKRWKN